MEAVFQNIYHKFVICYLIETKLFIIKTSLHAVSALNIFMQQCDIFKYRLDNISSVFK